MEEIWIDIQDYIGLYQVSNLARVKSVERCVESTSKNGKKYMKRIKEKILRQVLDNEGYLIVGLHKDGVEETKKVHQLVAQAFLPNTHNYTDVHHRNHDTTDNRIENLMWIDGYEHKIMHTNEQAKIVHQYTKDGLLVNIWKSANEAARILGFSCGAICACCNNKFCREGNNVYKDYIWSYDETISVLRKRR